MPPHTIPPPREELWVLGLCTRRCGPNQEDDKWGFIRGVKVRVEDARPDTFVRRGVPSEVEGERRGSVLGRTVMVIERRLKKARRK